MDRPARHTGVGLEGDPARRASLPPPPPSSEYPPTRPEPAPPHPAKRLQFKRPAAPPGGRRADGRSSSTPRRGRPRVGVGRREAPLHEDHAGSGGPSPRSSTVMRVARASTASGASPSWSHPWVMTIRAGGSSLPGRGLVTPAPAPRGIAGFALPSPLAAVPPCRGSHLRIGPPQQRAPWRPARRPQAGQPAR